MVVGINEHDFLKFGVSANLARTLSAAPIVQESGLSRWSFPLTEMDPNKFSTFAPAVEDFIESQSSLLAQMHRQVGKQYYWPSPQISQKAIHPVLDVNGRMGSLLNSTWLFQDSASQFMKTALEMADFEIDGPALAAAKALGLAKRRSPLFEVATTLNSLNDYSTLRSAGALELGISLLGTTSHISEETGAKAEVFFEPAESAPTVDDHQFVETVTELTTNLVVEGWGWLYESSYLRWTTATAISSMYIYEQTGRPPTVSEIRQVGPEVIFVMLGVLSLISGMKKTYEYVDKDK